MSDVSLSVNKELEKSLDTTILGDDLDIVSIKTENQLLRQLNTELLDKNDLLKEQLELKRKINEIKTYSEVTACRKDNQLKQTPSIIVKSKNNETKTNTYSEFLEM